MRIMRSGILALLLLLLLPAICLAIEKPQKKALIVGVNEYSADPRRYNLEGCENDADMMKQLLIYRFDFDPKDIKVIKSRNATLGDIRREMENHLIKGTKPGDLVVFFYSGHGTRVPEKIQGYSSDGYEEAICPSDAVPVKNNAKNVLFDVDIGDLLEKIPTDNIVVILDCCFSGTATKDFSFQGRLKYMDPQNGETFTNQNKFSSASIVKRLTKEQRKMKWVALSACTAWEKAQESRIEVNGQELPCGLLTRFLYQTLDKNPAISYQDAFTAIKREVVRENPAQTPQLEGTFESRNFFQMAKSSGSTTTVKPGTENRTSTKPAGTSAPSVTEVKGNEVVISKGAAGGLTKGSVFGVYPVGDSTNDPSTKIGAVEIMGVEALSSTGKILGGGGKIVQGCTVKEESHYYAKENLNVKFEQFQGKDNIIGKLSGNPYIKEAPGGTHADRIVGPSREGGLLAVYAPDGTLLQDFKGNDIKEVLPEVSRTLDSAYVMKRLSALTNPTPAFKVKLNLDVDKTKYRIGEEIGFRFQTDADCYLILLHVSSAGEVTLLFPNKYAKNNAVRQGQTYTIPPFENGKFLFHYKLAGPTGQEMVKAIATQKYVDPWGITMDNLQGVFKELKGDPVELADSLFLSLNKLLSGQKPMSVEQVSIPTSGGAGAGWSTDSLTYVITSN